ncbi:MAG: hypothetical protein AB8C84_08250 [Oligoflexales bacterium]
MKNIATTFLFLLLSTKLYSVTEDELSKKIAASLNINQDSLVYKSDKLLSTLKNDEFIIVWYPFSKESSLGHVSVFLQDDVISLYKEKDSNKVKLRSFSEEKKTFKEKLKQKTAKFTKIKTTHDIIRKIFDEKKSLSKSVSNLIYEDPTNVLKSLGLLGASGASICGAAYTVSLGLPAIFPTVCAAHTIGFFIGGLLITQGKINCCDAIARCMDPIKEMSQSFCNTPHGVFKFYSDTSTWFLPPVYQVIETHEDFYRQRI